MEKIFLLSGFQNWGKTHLINQLFGRSRFYDGQLYPLLGHDFLVLPQSNDDLGKIGYEDCYRRKMNALAQNHKTPQYILSAFCPTKEPSNLSEGIIKNLYSSDTIVMIPIEYKWCGHAKLQISEISAHYSNIPNVIMASLSTQDPAKKAGALRNILMQHLP
jgi:hypothetical protein